MPCKAGCIPIGGGRGNGSGFGSVLTMFKAFESVHPVLGTSVHPPDTLPLAKDTEPGTTRPNDLRAVVYSTRALSYSNWALTQSWCRDSCSICVCNFVEYGI